MSVAECVRLINEEDAGVAAAVGAARGEIVAFIEGVVGRMRPCLGEDAKTGAPAGNPLRDGRGMEESRKSHPDGRGSGGRLIYFGAGTSGRLGVLDASECPPTFQTPAGVIVGVIAGGDAALRVSSEGKEDEFEGARGEVERLGIGAGDSVLGIAAGGTTPWVLGALEMCAARGALTGLLTCARAPTPGCVRHHIVVETGAEVVTGSTRMKAGTATKMVVNMITTTVMVQLGKVHENLMVDVRATNDKLRDRAARIVAMLTGRSRGESFGLLERAGGDCKTAVVMERRGVSREDAEAMLRRAGGRLRAVIG